jgi:hypothetical protein
MPTRLGKAAYGIPALLGFVIMSIRPGAPAFGDAPAGAPQQPSPFSYFIGTWSCRGVFPTTGKTIASTIRFTQDGTSLVKHHDDLPPNGYHAIELWGLRAADGRFNAAIQDSFGGVRDFSSPGWNADSLVWTSAAQVQPQQQFAYTKKSNDAFEVDWRVLKNGSYIVGDTLTCARVER